jgi:glutathione S-transferase
MVVDAAIRRMRTRIGILAQPESMRSIVGLEPTAETGVTDYDPQGLSVGQTVTIRPDVNGGEQPVAGKIRFANAETVVIERTTDDVGTVCVHFPRSGYQIALP